MKLILSALALLGFSCLALEHTQEADSQKLLVRIQRWASGFSEITDIQWVPGTDSVFILQKTGELFLYHPKTAKKELFLKTEVATRSELGLLGCAFHPEFTKGKKLFYLNRTLPKNRIHKTVISEWSYETRKEKRVLLEIDQPYSNHNGGQLKFGPNALLYIGMGDGGSANDLHGNGQNPKTLLGKMLTLDVSQTKPEIFASGVRNPWRFTFSPSGELWIADVGQNAYEEIDIAKKGDNLGWNTMEANECFSPRTGCKPSGLISPIYQYGRDWGASITGGEFFLANPNHKAHGFYVFGDFVSGRLGALDPNTKTFYSLGKTDTNPSTFGKSPSGELFFADFAKGDIYQILFDK